MFNIIGYLISLIIISSVVTIVVEYLKRFNFVKTMVKFFNDKVKKLSFYQFESIVISAIILIVLNLLGAVSLNIFALILNSLAIGFLSNGIFTYNVVKSLLASLKITPDFFIKNN